MTARLELCLLLVIEILQALFEGSNDILASMAPWHALTITPDRGKQKQELGIHNFLWVMCGSRVEWESSRAMGIQGFSRLLDNDL